MIHNTYIVRISTCEILAETQYWPVEVEKKELDEFISTREELRLEDSSLANFPLIVGDDKYHGRDLIEDIILVFVTDKGEDESSIAERIDSATKALKRRLGKNDLEKVLEHYEIIIEPSVITRLKIALVGEGGVGKTTTLHLLMGDTPPLQYVPTIALNLETVENIRFGNYSLVLWDFAGQERFRNLWKFYFHGADVIFLVCDSSLRNVIISKDIHKLIKRDAPKVPVFALANKQDKPNAMRPEVVQKILGIPTYPMVAIDKSRRDEMLRILMTAAAQFVGVVLPDLPATELLKFTDEATAAASATEFESMVEEDEEEYEEVYVDEDGKIISASELGDEYEIVEEDEELEEVAEEQEFEEAEEEAVPFVVPTDEEPTIDAEEEPIAFELVVDSSDVDEVGVEIEADEEVEEEIPLIVEEEKSHDGEPDEVSIKDEDKPLSEAASVESPTSTAITEVSEVASTELADPDDMLDIVGTRFSSSPPEVRSEADDSHRIAKDLISEALDADDIIAAEIDRVSKDELDHALEAFSSDETISPGDEGDEDAKIADEALMELENILGTPDEPISSGKEDESEDFEDELDALDELFAVMSEEEEHTSED